LATAIFVSRATLTVPAVNSTYDQTGTEDQQSAREHAAAAEEFELDFGADGREQDWL